MGIRVKVHHLFFFALVLLSAIVAQSDDCVYTAYVRTGSILKGGTDSIISLALYDADGEYLEISNLESWGGLMGDRHDYFERGNLDIFSGRGRCLGTPLCAMNLTSDGSGPHHDWYCNYVEVTSTGAHISCARQLFTVEQWIARDAPPCELTAIRNHCPYDLKNHMKHHNQHQQQQIPSDLTVMQLSSSSFAYSGCGSAINASSLIHPSFIYVYQCGLYFLFLILLFGIKMRKF